MASSLYIDNIATVLLSVNSYCLSKAEENNTSADIASTVPSVDAHLKVLLGGVCYYRIL